MDDHSNTQNTAVFLNLSSIQQYVFNTNKLKHVVGASYIANTVYDDFPGKNVIVLNQGYKGGGNKLVIFDNEKLAIKRVQEFTLKTLKNYPGIVFKIGMMEDFKVEGGETNKYSDYQESMKSIIKNAGEQLSLHYPVTNLPKHGITADCPYSDLSADKVIYEYGYKQFVSQNVAAKLDPELWKRINISEQELLDQSDLQDYCFAREFDNMGQQKGVDSHIAIVHVDGNGIGKEFRKCKNLKEMISLSSSTDTIINTTFFRLLEEFKTIIPILKKLDLMPKAKIKIGVAEKCILPIRPIIIGGDDITMVCNSYLGIWVAQRFMHFFSEVSKEKLGNSYTSCAGVCITKTHYPFYRGYTLAEELCKNAKTTFYANEKQGNWIDFHVAMTDIPDKLSGIREAQYKNAEGASLTMRPYRADVFAERLSQSIKLKKLPNDWIKSLKSSIYAGDNACKKWKQKAVWREKKSPEVAGFADIFNGIATPYYDLVELSEIVLPELYENQKTD